MRSANNRRKRGKRGTDHVFHNAPRRRLDQRALRADSALRLRGKRGLSLFYSLFCSTLGYKSPIQFLKDWIKNQHEQKMAA